MNRLTDAQQGSKDTNSRHGQVSSNTIPGDDGKRFLVHGDDHAIVLSRPLQNGRIRRSAQPNIHSTSQIQRGLPAKQAVHNITMHVFVSQKPKHGHHFPSL